MRVIYSFRFIATAIASFLMAGHVAISQIDVVRSNARTITVVEGYDGRLEVDPTANPRKLVWRRAVPGTPLQVSIPFDLPGSVRDLGNGYFLLSGYDSVAGKAFLVRGQLVKAPSALIRVDETKDLGSIFDPWRVSFNAMENRLYVWDYLGKKALEAPWNGPIASFPGASSFQTIATIALIPALAYLWLYDMVYHVGKPGVVFFDTQHPIGTNAAVRYRLELDAQGAWTAKKETEFNTPGISDPAYSIKGGSQQNALGALLLKGPGGGFLVREIESNVPVYYSALPVNPDWWKTDDASIQTWNQVVVPSGILTPGFSYRVEPDGTPGITQSPAFYPVLRYGNPTSMSSAGVTYSLAKGDVLPWKVYVGNDNVAIDAKLTSSDTNQNGGILQSYLWLTLRPSDASPPITTIGQTVILSPVDVTYGPQEAEMEFGVCDHSPVFVLDVPPDDALEGVVAYFQLVIIGGNGVGAVTDVFATQILPSGGFPSQQQNSGNVATAKQNWRLRSAASIASRKAAALRWLNIMPMQELPNPVLNRAAAAVLRKEVVSSLSR
jgi:hypothetical protein